MKKPLLIIYPFLIIVLLASCSRVSVSSDVLAELTFKYGDISVSATLTKEESEQLSNIVNGKALYAGDPSCSFDVNISFRVGDRVFCPACDSCGKVKDCKTGKYFNISEAERETIEGIFEKYGGHFPCV